MTEDITEKEQFQKRAVFLSLNRFKRNSCVLLCILQEINSSSILILQNHKTLAGTKNWINTLCAMFFLFFFDKKKIPAGAEIENLLLLNLFEQFDPIRNYLSI